jgi:hypothetical protein
MGLPFTEIPTPTIMPTQLCGGLLPQGEDRGPAELTANRVLEKAPRALQVSTPPETLYRGAS